MHVQVDINKHVADERQQNTNTASTTFDPWTNSRYNDGTYTEVHMNYVINKLQRVNQWFDQLPEPTRFLLLMSMVTFSTFPLQLGVLFQYRWLTSISMFSLCFLCALAILRVSGGRRSGAIAIGMVILGLLTAIVMLTHKAL